MKVNPISNVFATLLLVLVITLVSHCEDTTDVNEESLVVETPIGTVHGFKQTLFGKNVNTFLGIPFAEPPVGKLRFKYPVAAKPRGVINATRFSPRCLGDDPFDNSPYSEDCLYLNIWSPSCSDNALKPVMVWIHGGGFMFGSASFRYYNGLPLAAYGDVVVVSMNYRLGAFGFLNLGGVDNINGSIGMHDQAMALKWVNDNINLFGGDPFSITLFGESAGSFSVACHMVSPLTRILFKRAILQSHGPLGERGNPNMTDYIANSWKFVEILGCSSQDQHLGRQSPPNAVLECLQTKEVSRIMESQRNITRKRLFGLFIPTKDGTFLPESPAILTQKGMFGDQLKDILIGVNSDEGTFFMSLLASKHFKIERPNFEEDVAKHIMKDVFWSLGEENIQEIFKFYSGKYRPPMSYKAVYESYGDFLITCPTVFTSEKIAEHKRRVYFYEFGYRYKLPEMDGTIFSADEWAGVPHFSDIPFVFGVPLMENGYTQEALDMSKVIMGIWTTFAKTGKPPENIIGLEWPLFTRENPHYVKLDRNRITKEIRHHADNCNLWRRIFREKFQIEHP